MERQCPACVTARQHTGEFEKIREAILGGLKECDLGGATDISELATALSVLVADALGMDIYK